MVALFSFCMVSSISTLCYKRFNAVRGRNGFSNFSNRLSECTRTSLHNHGQNNKSYLYFVSRYSDEILAVSQKVLTVAKVKL